MNERKLIKCCNKMQKDLLTIVDLLHQSMAAEATGTGTDCADEKAIVEALENLLLDVQGALELAQQDLNNCLGM